MDEEIKEETPEEEVPTVPEEEKEDTSVQLWKTPLTTGEFFI